MFLPLGDTPNPPRTAYVNLTLIGVNVAVFLLVSVPLLMQRPDLSDPLLLDYLQALGVRGEISARAVLQQVSAYDLFLFRHGFRPAAASVGTLLSAMFLHAGWLHLLGNMLFLYIFGDNVEYRLGRLGYLLAYLGTGAAATLFFALFVPGSQVPLVGASGAISGVLGFYYLWFPRNKVKTFVFLFPLVMGNYFIPARLVLGFYLVVDNLIPFLVNGGVGSGVAHGAHIGGFVAGLALAWGLDRVAGRAHPSRRRPPAQPEAPLRAATPADPVAAIASALREEDPARAVQLYLELPGREARQRLATDQLLAIGEYLQGRRAYDDALSLYRRLLAERPRDPDLARAYLGAGKALLPQPRGMTSATQYFLAAIDAARDPEVAAEARRQLDSMEQIHR